jgi:hypothetical protein
MSILEVIWEVVGDPAMEIFEAFSRLMLAPGERLAQGFSTSLQWALGAIPPAVGKASKRSELQPISLSQGRAAALALGPFLLALGAGVLIGIGCWPGLWGPTWSSWAALLAGASLAGGGWPTADERDLFADQVCLRFGTWGRIALAPLAGAFVALAALRAVKTLQFGLSVVLVGLIAGLAA